MLEVLFLLAIVALGIVVLAGILKLLFALVLLPFKIVLWTAKGLLGLLLIVPMVIVGILVITNIVPILLFLLLLPLFLVVAGVALFLKLVC